MSRTSLLLRRFSSAVPLLAMTVALWSGPAVSSAATEEMRPALTPEQKIVHTLNRLGFGARPGDIERVKAKGLEAYIRQQLHPEKIADAAVEKALEPLETLRMKTDRLVEE